MITILLFAHLQEVVGEEKMTWTELPITAGELKQRFSDKYNLPLKSVMVAVNEEYADEHLLLKDGDTVAFIPPVSGG